MKFRFRIAKYLFNRYGDPSNARSATARGIAALDINKQQHPELDEQFQQLKGFSRQLSTNRSHAKNGFARSIRGGPTIWTRPIHLSPSTSPLLARSTKSPAAAPATYTINAGVPSLRRNRKRIKNELDDVHLCC